MAEARQGEELLVDVYGCRPDRLRSQSCLESLLEQLIGDLTLHPIGVTRWHRFPAPGGLTALVLLSESHIAVHTFPERGFATINLYCCVPRPRWPWAEQLERILGAERTVVRVVERGSRHSANAGTLDASPCDRPRTHTEPV